MASDSEDDELSQADPLEEFEKLQERYQQLQEKKVRADANLETAQKRLDELKEEARNAYGTDDLAQLEAKLMEMEEENEEKKREYKRHLDEIEKGLSELESGIRDQDADAGSDFADDDPF